MSRTAREWDVLIFGSGIAGLGAAIGLAGKKQRVLVIGRQPMAGEASSRAAGILDPFLGQSPRSPLLPSALEAFRQFPGRIRRMEKETGLKAGYEKTGMLYCALDGRERKILEKRLEWQKKSGIPVRWVSREAILKKNPGLSPRIVGGLYYPSAGRIRADAMMRLLNAYVRRRGVTVLRSRSVPALAFKDGAYEALAGGRRHRAPRFINAAGSWSSLVPLNGRRLAVEPARGQIFILKGKAGVSTIVHTVHEGYLVPWEGNRFLAGSTVEYAGYRACTTAEGKNAILSELEKIVPEIRRLETSGSWAGLRPSTPDGFPVIGKIPGHTGAFAATGYFRSGILLGQYFGDLLAGAVMSGTTPAALKPFTPARFIRSKK